MIAFLCTGPLSSWDPVCSATDLLVLVVVSIVVGGGAGALYHRVLGGSGWTQRVFAALVGVMVSFGVFALGVQF